MQLTDAVPVKRFRTCMEPEIVVPVTCTATETCPKPAMCIIIAHPFILLVNVILSDTWFIGGPFRSVFPAYICAHLLFLPYMLCHESNSYCESALVHLTHNSIHHKGHRNMFSPTNNCRNVYCMCRKLAV